MISDLNNKVRDFCNTWEEYKQSDTGASKEMISKGYADPLTLEKLERINKSLDSQQETINRLQAALKRPFSSKDATCYSPMHLEHKKAFCEYLRTGNSHPFTALEAKGLSTISPRDGGFLVTQHAVELINEGVRKESSLRGHASEVVVSTDAYEVIEDFDNACAGWTNETDLRNITNTPTITKKIIPVYEMYAQPKATQKLIDDASIDVEEWLTGKLVESFYRLENNSFICGNGDGKPRGILNYANGKGSDEVEQILSGQDATITVDSILKLYYSLKEQFAAKGKFVMNRKALHACRSLVNPSSGQYLWDVKGEGSFTSTLLGCEVVQLVDMPEVASGSLAVAFGDFKSAYQIVDRQDISILRDPFSDKPFVMFYATKRVGGGLLNGQALKLLKLSAV